MSSVREIRGAGGGKSGGGGKARVAVESPDTLRSRQFARVVDLVSEGPIRGLVNGLQSVYLDDTPVQAADGRLNFSGITIETRPGTQDQDYIPGFAAAESEQNVSVEVTASTPVVRSITNPNINAVRITLGIPALTYQNPENGDLGGSNVEIAIDVQTDGGGWVPARLRLANVALAGSGTSLYSTTDILGANLSINWTGGTQEGKQSCGYLLEWRPVGGAWQTLASGGFSGTRFLSSYVDNPGGFENGGYYLPVYGAPSEGTSAAIDLAEGAYEFRLTRTSGTGTLSLSGTGRTWMSTDIISGKTTSRYQRSYRIELPPGGPWDIRVRRITPDSTKSNLQNATWFESYTEIIDAKLCYPNSALVALSVDAEQFNAIPRRGYEIYGLLVQIPSNYDPDARTYDGVWDGTLKTDWSNNPAWVFYDLCTSNRYGLGDFIDATQIDKWALYEIAQYCDELVPTGLGGMEPRFTCNLYLQTREEAFKVLNSIASIFRGMLYWSQGQITAIQDKPADVVAVFTPANVINGEFSYQGSSAKTRHTVALVTWNDPADRYRQKIEYVGDEEGIARFGVVETEVLAVGCTSRGQAHRMGRWLLYSERLETETVSFKAGMDAALVYPGAVIQTHDPYRSGQRMGGRLVAATLSAVTVDAPVEIEAGLSYELSVVMPDGSIATSALTNTPGTTTDLTLATPLPELPVQSAIWVLASSSLVPETWRVVSISEAEPGTVEITALAHHPDKYAAVEQDLVLEPLPTSAISLDVQSPRNLVVTESLYLVTPTLVGNSATLSWTSTSPSFVVSWRLADQNPQTRDVREPTITINGIEPGVYEFSVQAVNALGRRSAPVTITREIFGLSAPPVDVTGFTLAAIAGSAHIAFDPSPDLDVIVGGKLRIRHTAATSSADWNAAVDIGPAIPGSATSAVLPLVAGTYLAKWVDASGFESTSPAVITTTAPSIINMNFVERLEESPAFDGAREAVWIQEYGAGTALMLDSALTVGEMTDSVSGWPMLSMLGGVAGSGVYEFGGSVDLGAVHTSRLTAELIAAGINVDSRVSLWESVSALASIGGNTITDCSAVIQVRTTDEDPTAGLWSDWQPFFAGDWRARAYEFRLLLARGEPSHNIAVSHLAVTVDMPDRVQSGEDIAAPAAVLHVDFAAPFYARPALGITAEQMQTGDYYEITNKTETGFDIVFKNAAGTPVARTFDYIARSY